MRFPGGEMVGLYSHRWEIELGYREIKQTMQLSRLTLRSKKPELVEQELWGVLLTYNLVRNQMIKMAGALKGYWPNQLSFSESCGLVMRMLMTLKGASPGRIPELMGDLESLRKMVKLPIRRERAFPRVVKERPWKYPKATLYTILCKCLFSEVTVQAVTELDNKTAHCHTPVPQWHRPFL